MEFLIYQGLTGHSSALIQRITERPDDLKQRVTQRPDDASVDLQNPDGDQIRAKAEFNMMENINLLITEHCNLAYAHCGTGSPFARKMSHSAEKFYRWLDLLETKEIPFKYISLTGGEPFLHPEVRDGTFIRLLRTRYPSKRVGLTTNFFWASEERIAKYAPMVGMMNGGLGISIYEPIVKKLGGLDEFHRLAKSLKDACPNTWINVNDRPQFLAWEFHEDEREVKGSCGTSDCFVLKPDGKIDSLFARCRCSEHCRI
jgi:4Fe-4S single cluster domain